MDLALKKLGSNSLVRVVIVVQVRADIKAEERTNRSNLFSDSSFRSFNELCTVVTNQTEIIQICQFSNQQDDGFS